MSSDAVSSVKDPRVAALRALSTRDGRVAAGRCLLEGRSLIEQAAEAGAALDVVLGAESEPDPEPGSVLATLSPVVTVLRVRDGVLRQLAGMKRPVRWLASAALPPEVAHDTPWGELAVVCDGIVDPGNLGTVARTARGLGVEDLVLTDPATDVSSRRVLDASRGAALAMRIRRYDGSGSAVRGLQSAGFQVVATSPRGRQLQALAELDGRPVALVVGGETDGVGVEVESAADVLVAVPMSGVESLNVGVAAGIGIYELRTKMVLAMIEDRIRGTIGRDIAVAGRFVRAALDQAARDAADLSGEQVIALMVVTAEGQSPRGELSRDLGASDEAIITLVAPLVGRGWLRETDGGYAITESGSRAVAGFWPVQQQLDERLLAGLDAAERRTLRDLLARVRDNAMVIAYSPLE